MATTQLSLDSIPPEIEALMASEAVRTHWIPMTDMTGLVVAIAWRNDEKTAWQLFEAEVGGHC